MRDGQQLDPTYIAKNKADFYTLFDKYSRGKELANASEEHYVMAVLVRGGVFGESAGESAGE